MEITEVLAAAYNHMNQAALNTGLSSAVNRKAIDTMESTGGRILKLLQASSVQSQSRIQTPGKGELVDILC